MQGLMPVPGQSNANTRQTQTSATNAMVVQGLMPSAGKPDTDVQT